MAGAVPPEWTQRIPEIVSGYPDRFVAKPGHEADLKKRALTKPVQRPPGVAGQRPFSD